ncbi:hypothetical protein [Amycolatopsis anabasis]|uniref:hypothetical protein n=1 Tax=Amycolatopsis anabasis TaxID=1840409 RepID=UPI00131C6FD5|nr:hypothetical protein [Amycolatopsis anabasis]
MISPARYAVQLVFVWLIASLTLGTVALLLVGGVHPDYGFRSLAELSNGALSLLFLLLVLLVAGLAVLVARTGELSWVADDPRGKVVWVLLVGGLGFAGWGYAATVTFGAFFPPGVQIALAYFGGGLPFALIAAMLQRPRRVNAAAFVLAVIAVVAGWAIVGGGPFSVVRLYLEFLQQLLRPVHALGI